MEPILEQIRATFDCGIWYPVVSSMLMLPDACGAAEFWGQAKKPRQRYVEWYDKWVHPNFSAGPFSFDGSVVYIVRNAMMHESTGFTRGQHGFDRVLFMPPNPENNTFNFCLHNFRGEFEETAVTVDILLMFEAIEAGVLSWLAEVRGDADKRREDAIKMIMQYHPDGRPPYFIGIPYIA